MICRLAALVGWMAGLGAAVAVLLASTGPLLHRLGEAAAAPDTVVAGAAAAAAWLVAAWLGLGLALTVIEVALAVLTKAWSAPVGRVASRITPAGVRRTVHRSVRAGLVAGAVGTTLVAPTEAFAVAAPATADVRPTDLPLPTSWPVLDRPAFPVHGPAARPAQDTRPRHPDGSAGRYRVRPGDSLWSIAADHLPAHARPGDVARAWPRWWRANHDVVGADPGLIRPGQLLRIPGASS